MKLTKLKLKKLIKEEMALINEADIGTKSATAKKAQKLFDLLVRKYSEVFQALAKDPVASKQFISYIASVLKVDLTKATEQSAVKAQAAKIGVGKEKAPEAAAALDKSTKDPSKP
jgi:hypothetical protein